MTQHIGFENIAYFTNWNLSNR